jgi:hypothetical protein
VLVSYDSTAGYHLWNPAERKIFNSHNVAFKEGIGHCMLPPEGGDLDVAGGTEDKDEPHVPIAATEPETDKLAPASGADIAPVIPSLLFLLLLLFAVLLMLPSP